MKITLNIDERSLADIYGIMLDRRSTLERFANVNLQRREVALVQGTVAPLFSNYRELAEWSRWYLFELIEVNALCLQIERALNKE